jgi:hypothetical protein
MGARTVVSPACRKSVSISGVTRENNFTITIKYSYLVVELAELAVLEIENK